MSIDLRSTDTEPNIAYGTTAPGSARRLSFQGIKDKLRFGIRGRAGAPPRPHLLTVPTQGRFYDVAADVLGLRTNISNVFMIGAPGSSHWALIDAGMPGAAHTIISAAEHRFGAHIPPSAIVLTHGHFDHIGSLMALLDRWDVPVYAHPLEMPYLTGRSSYPPPDPSVGRGCMSLMSSFYPKKPIDLGHRVRSLPADGQISQLPGWSWIHTPGHTAGHISLFREEDRVLIAGDAVVTIRAESMIANFSRHPELCGPPMYFTPDWKASRESVRLLASMEPDVLATGHGIPLHGEAMRRELLELAVNFELRAVPDRGRYLREPALADEQGVISIPPVPGQPVRSMLLVLGGLLAGFGLAAATTSRPKSRLRDLLMSRCD